MSLSQSPPQYSIAPCRTFQPARTTPHAFVNISSEPGEFIAVFTPGGTDKFFAEFGPMMISGGPPNQEKIAALMEKHGMTLLGPPLSPE